MAVRCRAVDALRRSHVDLDINMTTVVVGDAEIVLIVDEMRLRCCCQSTRSTARRCRGWGWRTNPRGRYESGIAWDWRCLRGR